MVYCACVQQTQEVCIMAIQYKRILLKVSGEALSGPKRHRL